MNYGLSVIMMCQCRFINCNKCTTLVGDINIGEGVCMRGGRGKLYLMLNIAVKNKVYKLATRRLISSGNLMHCISDYSQQYCIMYFKVARRVDLKCSHQKRNYRDFPGGAVVKNPPANAGDTGSSPGPGRSHMPRSN